MSFISAIGAWFVGIFTKDVMAFVWGLIMKAWQGYQERKAIEAQAAKDVAQLQAAKTQDEKEAAANAINKDTFS